MKSRWRIVVAPENAETWMLVGQIDTVGHDFLRGIPSEQMAIAWADTLRRGVAAYSEHRWEEALGPLCGAAMAGCAVAATMVGSLFHLGLGVAVDGPVARRWYEAGAAGGDPLAAWNLATLLDAAGVPEALLWRLRAKKLGFERTEWTGSS